MHTYTVPTYVQGGTVKEVFCDCASSCCSAGGEGTGGGAYSTEGYAEGASTCRGRGTEGGGESAEEAG